MVSRDQSRFWRNCRIAFRRFRMGAWVLILILLGALFYLNQIGLPGFVKRPLLQKLRARGLDLQFSRLRLRWDHGIVAENVHFGRADEPASPKLRLKEVDVQLNYSALAKLQFQVDSLVLRQGFLTWPVSATNTPPRELSVDNIQTELHLLPGDLWELDHFRAQFAGGEIQLTGIITNASAVRDWKWFHPREPTPAEVMQNRLRRWAETLEQIRFPAPPRLAVDVRGDARDLRSFAVRLKLNAPGAETPWGRFQQGLLSVQLRPAASNELSHAEIRLEAESAQTSWAAATNLALTLRLVSTAQDTNAVQAELDLAATRVKTEWGGATRAHLTSQWIHSFTNAIPLSGTGKLELEQPETRWGSATTARLAGSLSPSDNALAAGDSSWAWWTNLAPWALAGECRLTGLRSPKLEADEIFCAGQWRAPELHATQLSARLYEGRLNAEARLSAATRELRFTASSDFDVQRIASLLTEKSRHWLSQYSWKIPPQLQAEGALILPEWTNRHPDWRLEVKPTVGLRGQLHVTNGAFRGVATSTADAHFFYSNEVWRLPDLTVTRPEGGLELVHESNERTRDYYFRVHSTIDLRVLRPLLEPKQLRVVDLVGFTQPPVIDGEVRGRWYEPERIGVNARVALTNFTLRGQSADVFQAGLEYSNRFLELIEPRLLRGQGSQQLAASSVGVDFSAQRVYVTNGYSTAEPLTVARAIGPHIGQAFEPYHFLQPPTVHVAGIIPFHGEKEADLHFDVDGGGFEWWKFNVPRITGKVDWVKERLMLRDIRTDFYGGVGAGNAQFDFHPGQATDFSFNATVTGADLHSLTSDLSSKTNRLEGILSARLGITQANSRDWQSWQGKGRVDLRDGLIWEIPVFGILSPVLDAIIPGLGSSRASEGSAAFVVTNGVLSSDDLEIRASIMRLQYWGNIDLAGRVNAHAEAELLRDAWVVGRVLSLALWPVSKLFEYQITGTLHEPRIEPVFFVPKLMLLPLHPLRTLKDLAPEKPDFSQTNAPTAVVP